MCDPDYDHQIGITIYCWLGHSNITTLATGCVSKSWEVSKKSWERPFLATHGQSFPTWISFAPYCQCLPPTSNILTLASLHLLFLGIAASLNWHFFFSSLFTHDIHWQSSIRRFCQTFASISLFINNLSDNNLNGICMNNLPLDWYLHRQYSGMLSKIFNNFLIGIFISIGWLVIVSVIIQLVFVLTKIWLLFVSAVIFFIFICISKNLIGICMDNNLMA